MIENEKCRNRNERGGTICGIKNETVVSPALPMVSLVILWGEFVEHAQQVVVHKHLVVEGIKGSLGRPIKASKQRTSSEGKPMDSSQAN